MRKEILYEINAILSNISKALNAARSTVFLVDQKKKVLESLVSQGIRNNLIAMPIGCGVAGYVAKTGDAQIVNCVKKSDLFNPYFDNITGFKTEKILCTPIISGNKEIVGVIQSLNKLEGDFNKKDLSILKSFAEAIALAIKNAKLYSSAEAIKKDISTLLKVSSSINSELDLSSLLKLIIKQASEITQSDRSSFFLLDEEEKVLWTKFGEGLGSKIIKTKKGLASYVAKNKKALIENNPYENPYFDQSVDAKMGYRTKSIISVPVFDASRKLIGVIQSINKKDGLFTNKELFILNGFAAQISIAIQNSTLFEEINNIKNYLNILFENLDNGILTIDKDGIIKTVNKRFCAIIGVQQEALIGKYYKSLAPKQFSFLDYSEYTFRSGEKFEKHHIESIDINNQKLIFNFNALPMKTKNGGNIGVINVIKDITSEERVRENLNRYLPQHVINEIINKDDLSLFNGQYRQCSILFSDIRNFTSLTEPLEAIETVKLLNNYFDVMVESIFNYQGVLDKLIGDAIMATFGIPYKTNNDAVNAVCAGIEMIGKLGIVNQFPKIESNLDIGVGIATGNVISGNIGSKKRFEYTVIGNAVNLASRLESLTKFYGLRMLICEHTFKEVAHLFHCREIDCIKAKGKQKSVTIYTILNKADVTLSRAEQAFIKSYADGLVFYRNKNFTRAIEAFTKTLTINPSDKPAQILLSRCKDYEQVPPNANWSGTWAFSQK